MPTLAAIVPATNAPPTLERCLEAIRAADDQPEELLVVHDPHAGGPAAARNAGAARATAEVLVFVDADVVVHRDAFTRIRGGFAADPELTAVFGSYDDTPAEKSMVSTFRNLLHHHVHQSAPGPARTFWAGLGAVRRTAFLELGGFDDVRFPHSSIEDIELGARLAEAGRRIMLDPALQGTHLKRWTLAGMVRVDLARRGMPWIGLLLRTRSGTTALNLGWRHRLSAAAALLALTGVARRRVGAVGFAGAAMVALNYEFYALLARRQGLARAATGVALHTVHHLTGVVAVPAGAAAYALRRLRDRSQ